MLVWDGHHSHVIKGDQIDSKMLQLDQVAQLMKLHMFQLFQLCNFEANTILAAYQSAWGWQESLEMLFTTFPKLLGGGFKYFFYFHPETWGKISNLTSIFFKWVETKNQVIFETKFHFFQYNHDLGLTCKAVAIGVGAYDGNATEDGGAVDLIVGGWEKWWDGGTVGNGQEANWELMCDCNREIPCCPVYYMSY